MKTKHSTLKDVIDMYTSDSFCLSLVIKSNSYVYTKYSYSTKSIFKNKQKYFVYKQCKFCFYVGLHVKNRIRIIPNYTGIWLHIVERRFIQVCKIVPNLYKKILLTNTKIFINQLRAILYVTMSRGKEHNGHAKDKWNSANRTLS